MRFGVGQVEAAAEHVAELVVNPHAGRAQGDAGQIGAVARHGLRTPAAVRTVQTSPPALAA